MKISSFSILLFLQFASVFYCNNAQLARYKFVLQETAYTRLCSTKNILTVNGQFPGPTLFVQKGETIIVDVTNNGRYNVTLHWHGVAQPRNPWSDAIGLELRFMVLLSSNPKLELSILSLNLMLKCPSS
ncbi:hypothetical protein ACFE04_005835 [Oxalis oulophora]